MPMRGRYLTVSSSPSAAASIDSGNVGGRLSKINSVCDPDRRGALDALISELPTSVVFKVTVVNVVFQDI